MTAKELRDIVQELREMATNMGASLDYLPPYSPIRIALQHGIRDLRNGADQFALAAAFIDKEENNGGEKDSTG